VAPRIRNLVRIVGKSFTASHRHARMSPYKARPVIDLVRGKAVEEALSILEFQDRRSAPMIRAVIQSALANASNDLEVKLGRLVVSEATVDGGPLLGGRKRFMQRAMGRAFPIHKRTCHIVVTISEAEIASTKRPSKGGRRRKGDVQPLSPEGKTSSPAAASDAGSNQSGPVGGAAQAAPGAAKE
jgi:large subunit ribosomal protein L22